MTISANPLVMPNEVRSSSGLCQGRSSCLWILARELIWKTICIACNRLARVTAKVVAPRASHSALGSFSLHATGCNAGVTFRSRGTSGCKLRHNWCWGHTQGHLGSRARMSLPVDAWSPLGFHWVNLIQLASRAASFSLPSDDQALWESKSWRAHILELFSAVMMVSISLGEWHCWSLSTNLRLTR